MPTVHLTDRSTIVVAGPEAEHFLQNLVTTDLDKLGRDEMKPGALLSPQGKILFDFLVSRRDDGLCFDVRADVADDFVRRLMLYKLRAKVTISKQDQGVVTVSWGSDSVTSQPDSSASQTESTLRDSRFAPNMDVWRGDAANSSADATVEDWNRLRIASGIAESGADYALGDAFPHDVLLDETGGVGFRKGCYVGQEVVSRMHHRGTARRRVLIVEGDRPLPPPGTEIKVNGRAVGSLGTVSGKSGLAIMRIDRVKDALDADLAIQAGDAILSPAIPAWAKFTYPKEAAAAEEG